MAMDKDELMLLGKIDGKLDGISAHLNQQDKRIADLDARVDARLNGIDERLREVEKKAAVAGAVSGGAELLRQSPLLLQGQLPARQVPDDALADARHVIDQRGAEAGDQQVHRPVRPSLLHGPASPRGEF